MATAREIFNQNWGPGVGAYTYDTAPQYLLDEAARMAGGASTGATGDYSPAGLASVFKQAPVTLPGAEEAKTGLRGLQTNAVGGFNRLLAADPSAEREALRKAIFANLAEPVNYEADRLSRDIQEGQNAKNMLYSTGTSYLLDPIERGRAIGLERAANDAYMTAGNESRANTASQATLLGQAFSTGTTGLQADANVENAQANRDQSATQTAYQTGLQREENAANRTQQNEQFGRSLGQQKDLYEQGLANQKEIASNAALGAGISGGLSGLASLFGPSINRTLKNVGF